MLRAHASLGFWFALVASGLLLLATGPGPAAAAPPDGRVITITAPRAGTAVSSPFTITGTGTTTPFEANLAYRVYDAAGAVVGQGGFTVQGMPGGAYNFVAPITFAVAADGPGRVELVDIDASGGTPFATASLNVTLLAGSASRACFATGFCVEGRFFETWVSHGGLAIHGLPLSGVFDQVLEDGNTYAVQYFERVRMEYHPGNQPPYDVLLGQFGRQILAGVRGAPTARAPQQPGVTYFEQTGHNVGPRFSALWEAYGGLTQFGYPLTELFEQRLEDGNTYAVQYFERARFEHHPEYPPPNDVLLGQFGRQILAETTQRAVVIAITSPQEGATVGSPFEVRGTISRLPFERNLAYRVTAADTGIVLTQGAITVQGPDAGPGTFVARIAIPGGFSGRARVEVRDLDVSTGAVVASASVTVSVTSP